MGGRFHARCRSLLQRSEIVGEERSRKGKWRFHSRLAALLVRRLADSRPAGEAAFVRKSYRSISRSREVLRSAARGCADPFRRQTNHWLPAPAEECERAGAAGNRGEWLG